MANHESVAAPSDSGWIKNIDGKWKNARYASGNNSLPSGMALTYNEEVNGGSLVIGDQTITLSFRELQELGRINDRVIGRAQEENTRLYNELREMQLRGEAQ